jgi:hypothetical protein
MTTITHWVNLAKEALNNAVKISEETGESFYFSYGSFRDMEYVPESSISMNKTKALELLRSGHVLTEAERIAIRKAIEDETITNEDDGWYQSDLTGWISSSDRC